MDEVELNWSSTDVKIIGHALNEIVNGVKIPDIEYVPRIGAGRSSVRTMLDKPREQFTREDLLVLKRALREICFGDIAEFEFPARLTQPRDVVCNLLMRLTDYLHASWRPEHVVPRIRIS